ncbi:MAG: MATE family efflux transporter [Bacteroidales bacterium]|jgi:putative MATE family efflux protein|nr:MATE family efflux transporter [Bacteroidales bacterium]
MPTGAKDFTRGAIFEPLVRLALPIMATSFVQMAYSLTDMAWVGRLGSESVAAVGSVGMLVWLTSSFAVLSKIASEVSIGQAIGARKRREAMAYASHTTTISLMMALILAAILYLGAGFILSFFKLSPQIQDHAVGYLQTVSTAIPFSFLVYNFMGIYNGVGRSNIPFYLVASGLVCNMLLDPLLIFGIHGVFEGMGVKGAAIATWMAQGFVFLLFVYRLRRNDGILNRFPFLIRLRGSLTLRVLRLGFPVAMMTLFFASINTYLARVASVHGGHLGITTQTAGGQIEGITWNTSQGFSTALGAFTAQNFAAGKVSRSWMAYRYTLGIMLSLGVFVTVAFLFFGDRIFGVIIPEATGAGGDYLFVMGFSQVFMMLELTTQGMFNGMGRTLPPAIVSIVFNFARIPLALLFAAWLGITGVWWAISASSILKGIVLPLWLVRSSRRSNEWSIPE